MKKFVQEYKADINGEGCLHAALEFYHTPLAEFLIKSGCNINQVFNMFTYPQFLILSLSNLVS